MKELLESSWQKGISYGAYRDMITKLRLEDRTTGTNHSPEYLNYTDLNVTRMNRWDKHFNIDTGLLKAHNKVKPQLWLVITEAWCGDAAHALPVMNKLAEGLVNVQLRCVLRDENIELMDNFLTNGGRSIPKLIVLDHNFDATSTWGPRPTEAQRLMQQLKSEKLPKAEINSKLQVWYSRDRGSAIATELLGLQ